MRIQLIFRMLLLFVPCLGSSQPLSDLLVEARVNNLELKALQQEYLSALERSPQMGQLPNPEIGLGVFLSPVETRLGGQQARLSLGQQFPWFGTLEARKEVANAQAKVLSEKVAAAALKLEFELKQAYFQLYEMRETQAIIRRNLQLLAVTRKLALAKVESGQGKSVAVLQVDLKIRELEQELLILDKQSEKPLAKFNQLSNRPLDQTVIVQDTFEIAVIPFERDTLINHIRRYHPMLRMYTLQQEVAQNALALNQLEGKPSFGFSVDYILVSPRSDAIPLNNGRDIAQLGAKVSLPLWRQKYEAKKREENLKITALEQRKADVVSRFLSEIERAYSDYETALLREELYIKQIEITKAAIRISQTDYSNSGTKFAELLGLEASLIDFELKRLKWVVRSQLALASIEQYLNF